MRIVLLLCDSVSNRYLIKQFRDNFDIVGIVIQGDAPESLFGKFKKIGGPIDIIKHAVLRILTQGWHQEGRSLEKKFFSIRGKPYDLPYDTPLIKVKNINGIEVRNFIIKFSPDLAAVSGTQLLREPILSLCPRYIKEGIVNMHTGLSPYIRGGSATFWALHSGQPQYIGVTIHYVDKDIDKGDIILSSRPDNIEVNDTDYTLDAKVRYLGISLYIKAIKQIENGINKRVKQWQEGQLFAERTGYKKTLSMIYELQKRLKKDNLLKRYLDNKGQYDKGIIVVE